MTQKLIRIEGIIPPYMHERIKDTRSSTAPYLADMSGKGKFFPRTPGNAARVVFDAQDGEERPGVQVRSEGQAATGDNDTDKAYDFTGTVRDYYKEIHNWNSIDNEGMRMISVVHFKEKFNNAFWDGRMMTYGRGDQVIFRTFVLPDICGHEITHGVTQFVANILYFGQSGAINESLSDVFGKLIEMYANKTPVSKFDWVVGRGCFMPEVTGRGIRDMMNPGTAYRDVKLGKDPQPAHMKDYIVTTRDKGGVHANSGIPNRAFALCADAIGGFAWDKVAHIWFEARANCGDKPSFASFAAHTVEACGKLGFASETDKVNKAWLDVGVTPSLTAVDTITPPAPPRGLPFPGEHDDDDGHGH